MVNKTNLILILGTIFIIILYIPFLIFGENSYVGSSSDYLDSVVVWMKILAESGLSFAPNNTPLLNIENQFRVSYINELDFIYLLFKIFTPYYALILNSFLITIIGYFSLYKLGKHLVPKISEANLVIISLTFSLLNFWQFGGISIAGLPLLILIFLKIFKKEKLTFFEIIFPVFYLFYSSFIVSGMFLVFLLFLTAIYYFIKERKIQYKPLLFILLLFVGYLITNYRFLLETIKPTFISTRTIGVPAEIDWNTGLKVIIERFWSPQVTHAPFMHHIIVLIFVSYLIWGFFRKLPNYRNILLIFSLIIFTTIFSYFNFNLFPSLIQALHLDFVFGLTLYRFYFFNGVLWYIILLLIIADLRLHSHQFVLWGMMILLVVNFYFVLRVNIPYQNIRHSFREYYFSFKDYYMIEEFKKIDAVMPKNKEKYRVLSYGFEPAAAEYNGYYTADGYFPYYEKSYKIKFRNLISPILNNNDELRTKYDSYMNQNFVFVDNFDVGKQILQKYAKNSKELGINSEMLLELDVKYIFSSIPLTNDYLQEIKVIKSKYWENIYIYKVDNDFLKKTNPILKINLRAK